MSQNLINFKQFLKYKEKQNTYNENLNISKSYVEVLINSYNIFR